MPLEIGSTLGVCEVLSAIGAGFAPSGRIQE
jgi:hypothetical protein